jgi:hypothetical protein
MFVRWIKRQNSRGEYNFCYLSDTKWIEGKPKNRTLAALGSITLKPTKPEREVFWMQAKSSLDALNLTTQERAKVEAALAQKVPRGKNPHGDSDAPVEWYTPPEYVEMARLVLGGIDLDPASNKVAQGWIKAGIYYTAEIDGMIQPWFGRVWCNPPYGRQVNKWLEKALASYQDEKAEAIILLLNRTGASWYKHLLRQVTAVCEVDKRIAFIDANGHRQSSPRYYNDFVYLGKDVETFSRVFGEIGDFRKTPTPLST